MQYTPSRTPLAHASSHEHGGSDEVATATPTANAIPKADSAGRISSGWLADVQTVADMAARHALTVAFKVKQTDTGHIHLFLGGDITSEANWLDLGHCNVAPSNTAVPTITGTAQVDVQLTAAAGTYAGYPAPSHASWQWQVSDDGATGWSDISGATSSTYTPVSADEGKYLRAKEGQSNSLGTVYAYSAATGGVQAAVVSRYRITSGLSIGVDPENLGSGYVEGDTCRLDEGSPETHATFIIHVSEGIVSYITCYPGEGCLGGDYAAPLPDGSHATATLTGEGSGLKIITGADSWEPIP